MLTTGEERELRQIEAGLREQDSGFARRLRLLQGLLRWAAPGRQGYLLAVTVVAAAALLRAVTAPGRLLIEVGYWSAPTLAPSVPMAFPDMAWPGWDSM